MKIEIIRQCDIDGKLAEAKTIVKEELLSALGGVPILVRVQDWEETPIGTIEINGAPALVSIRTEFLDVKELDVRGDGFGMYYSISDTRAYPFGEKTDDLNDEFKNWYCCRIGNNGGGGKRGREKEFLPGYADYDANDQKAISDITTKDWMMARLMVNASSFTGNYLQMEKHINAPCETVVIRKVSRILKATKQTVLLKFDEAAHVWKCSSEDVEIPVTVQSPQFLQMIDYAIKLFERA